LWIEKFNTIIQCVNQMMLEQSIALQKKMLGTTTGIFLLSYKPPSKKI
jgi:hypothetical protein